MTHHPNLGELSELVAETSAILDTVVNLRACLAELDGVDHADDALKLAQVALIATRSHLDALIVLTAGR